MPPKLTPHATPLERIENRLPLREAKLRFLEDRGMLEECHLIAYRRPPPKPSQAPTASSASSTIGSPLTGGLRTGTPCGDPVAAEDASDGAAETKATMICGTQGTHTSTLTAKAPPLFSWLSTVATTTEEGPILTC